MKKFFIPLFFLAIIYNVGFLFDSDTGHLIFLLLLLYPSITFLISFFTGLFLGFNIFYNFAVFVIFLPTIFIFLQGQLDTVIYGFIYFAVSILANFLGALVKRSLKKR